MSGPTLRDAHMESPKHLNSIGELDGYGAENREEVANTGVSRAKPQMHGISPARFLTTEWGSTQSTQVSGTALVRGRVPVIDERVSHTQPPCSCGEMQS